MGNDPRIVVTLDYTLLTNNVGHATLLGSNHPITPGEARRIACDAGILPIILGGDSQPLDVGREKRLFTGALRQAIYHRDQGCAFPGCDRAPADCDIHHIIPWWNGGTTSLPNAVTLCSRHHHHIEPKPGQPADSQWHIQLDHRGLPTFTTPTRPDGTRITQQHHRYRT